VLAFLPLIPARLWLQELAGREPSLCHWIPLLREMSHQLVPWAQVLGQDSNCYAASLMHRGRKVFQHLGVPEQEHWLMPPDGTKSLLLFRLPD
jgi:hypothetical protein